MNEQNHASEMAANIASAPGSLPMPLVQKRDSYKAIQFRHDNLISPFQPTPSDSVSIVATSGAALPIARAEIWYTTDGSWPNESSQMVPMPHHQVIWQGNTSYINEWQGFIPPQQEKTLVRYKIVGFENGRLTPTYTAHDGTGFWFHYAEEGLTTFAYRVRKSPQNLPDWMDDAIIYQIFLDRFRGNSGQLTAHDEPNHKHGGTIQGVIDSLPYLGNLGINCIWLSPVGPADTYHRYDQRDFFGIDPDLGSESLIKTLVQEAHQRGIRLILDFVPAHASWHMPQFKAAQADQNAPTSSWFVFEEWPDKYRCFLGVVPMLVSFNSNDDGARQYLIDSSLYWLCEVGFDGLRLDHAIGHGMDFWAVYSKALEEAKPDVALFGEATDTPNALKRYNGRLQGILDFPVAQALRMSFGLGEWTVAELNGIISAYTKYMSDGPSRVTFIDNHDMDRFLYIAKQDKDRLKMALLCLFTLPHTPVIYYGTEIGMSQDGGKDDGGFGGDHVIRGNMIWDKAEWDSDIYGFTKTLIALRLQNNILRRGEWASRRADAVNQIWAYQLTGEAQSATIVFNLGSENREVPLDCKHPSIACSTNSANALSNPQTLDIAPLSGVLIFENNI
ncbi:MAG: alpha-amylase family glycosyl hydrolase [Chloroflexota bacterium]